MHCEEDCRRAVVVISAREAPTDCAALTIDRRAWQVSRGFGPVAGRRPFRNFGCAFGSICSAMGAQSAARNLARATDTTEPNRSGEMRDATPRIDDLRGRRLGDEVNTAGRVPPFSLGCGRG